MFRFGVARHGAKCAQFRVGINTCGLMVRTTYRLVYEVNEDAFSQEQEIVRPAMEFRTYQRMIQMPG